MYQPMSPGNNVIKNNYELKKMTMRNFFFSYF